MLTLIQSMTWQSVLLIPSNILESRKQSTVLAEGIIGNESDADCTAAGIQKSSNRNVVMHDRLLGQINVWWQKFGYTVELTSQLQTTAYGGHSSRNYYTHQFKRSKEKTRYKLFSVHSGFASYQEHYFSFHKFYIRHTNAKCTQQWKICEICMPSFVVSGSVAACLFGKSQFSW